MCACVCFVGAASHIVAVLCRPDTAVAGSAADRGDSEPQRGGRVRLRPARCQPAVDRRADLRHHRLHSPAGARRRRRHQVTPTPPRLIITNGLKDFR